MKTCLIVDDSGVVRKIARKMIEEMGFDCREAEDGAVAFSACVRQMPEVILLDWNMPVMDGMAFLKKLRDMPDGKIPQVIFCTTENDIGKIDAALSAGADEYIMKPFDSGILRGKFEQIGIL